FFQAPSTTHSYTLSLHDALPISSLISSDSDQKWGGVQKKTMKNRISAVPLTEPVTAAQPTSGGTAPAAPPITMFCGERRFSHTVDRKSTRLNSSHVAISYAVFCL